MASFPSLKSGAVTMTPVTRTRRFATDVIQFADDSEQRWASLPTVGGVADFVLSFSSIDGYDLDNIREFWRSMKGRYDSTWDITVAGVLYERMAFDSDEFEATETIPNRFNLTLKCIQTR